MRDFTQELMWIEGEEWTKEEKGIMDID